MRSQLHSQLMLQQATDLNTQAVESLTGGRTAEALKTFRRALDTLYEIEDTLTPPTPNISGFSSSSPHRIWVSKQLPILKEGDDAAGATSSLPAYDRALQFSHQASTLIYFQHLRFYSAAVLFNMGLSFHMRGKLHASRYQTSPNQYATSKENQLYSKAAACYEQTLQYLDSIQDDPAGEADRNWMRLLARNNRCQIQQHQYNKQTHSKQDQRDSNHQYLMVELLVGLEHIRKLLSTVAYQSSEERRQSSVRRVSGDLIDQPLVPTSTTSQPTASTRPQYFAGREGAAAA